MPRTWPSIRCRRLTSRSLSFGVAVHQESSLSRWKRRRRRLFKTTNTLENAIAAGGDDRAQKPRDRERDRGHVVGERPEEVLLDRPQRAAREPDRIHRGTEVAGDERQVAGLDRDVGARSDREAEVGLRERRGVVDAVADHRHRLPLALELCDDVPLSVREDACDHAVDARLGADRRGGALVVPGQQHGHEAERTEVGDRPRRRRLDAIGEDEGAATARRRSPRRPRSGRSPPPLRPRRRARGPARARTADRRRPSGPRRPPRCRSPARLVKLSTGPARPPPSARANAAIARAIGCSLASSAEPASRTSSRAVDAIAGDDADDRQRRPRSRCRSCRARSSSPAASARGPPALGSGSRAAPRGPFRPSGRSASRGRARRGRR